MDVTKLCELDKKLYECEDGRALIDIRNDKLILLFIEFAMMVPGLKSRVKAIVEAYIKEAKDIVEREEVTTSTKSLSQTNAIEPPKTLAALATKT